MRMPCIRWRLNRLPGHGDLPRSRSGALVRFQRQMPVSWATESSSHRDFHTNPVSGRYMVNSQDFSPLEPQTALVDTPRTTSSYHDRIRGEDSTKKSGSNTGVKRSQLRKVRGPLPDRSSLDNWPSYIEALEHSTKKAVWILKERQAFYLSCELEHASAEGVSSPLSLYKLLDAECELNVATVLQPFSQHYVFICKLHDILKTYRHKHNQLFNIGWSVRFHARELGTDLKTLDLIQRTKFTPYREGIGRYNIISLKSAVTSAALATNLELHHALGQLLYCHNIPRLKARFHMTRLGSIAVNLIKLQAEVFTIRLRKDESNKRQTVFNAFYHRWGLTVTSAHKATADLKSKIESHQKIHSGMWSEKNHNRTDGALNKINTLWDRLYFLYRDYLPVYMRRLDLMSASELDQNILDAKRYWFTYYHTGRENEQRMAKLEKNMIKIQEAYSIYRKKQQRPELLSGDDYISAGFPQSPTKKALSLTREGQPKGRFVRTEWTSKYGKHQTLKYMHALS